VAQLGRLNRIVALKELGFTLEQVKSIVESKVDVAELRGMLRLRQAELQSQIASDTARLAEVEQRLRLIETEGGLPGEDVVVKALPAVRVAELTGRAGGFEPRFITPVVRPLFTELCLRLDRAGVAPVGPAIAYYERDGDESVIVHAAIPVNRSAEEVTIVDLPAVARAATIVHRGPIEQVMSTVQLLARWFDANGLRPAGYGRELYLHTGEGPWVTELQEPIEPERTSRRTRRTRDPHRDRGGRAGAHRAELRAGADRGGAAPHRGGEPGPERGRRASPGRGAGRSGGTGRAE
jgi:effector-binding domain-containing protein